MRGALPSLRSPAVRLLVLVRERRWQRLERGLRRAAGLGDARAAARLLRRSSLDVSAAPGRLRGRGVGRRPPRIAVLARSQFTDDARALAHRLGEERVLLIRREALKALASANLPAGTYDFNYRTVLSDGPDAMRRHRAFLRDVWSALDPHGDVRLVLTANTGYWAEIELGAALEELDVAFVALHKENLKSPGHAARWEPVYRETRAPFLGRAVLVQNAAEADLQVRGGVAPPERITVVGMARLDAFHAHRRRTAGTRTDGDVLFAGFLPGLNLPMPPEPPGRDVDLGVPLPDPERRPEHLVEACLALHRVAIEVARALPERHIVLKTKGREQDRRWTPVLLDRASHGRALPGNLRIVHGGDAPTMTREAAVVVGLNSTMLLEAIAAGRPAVVLELGEMDGPARPFLVPLEGAAAIVRDETEAALTILRIVREAPEVPAELDERTLALLDRWTGNADGRATERTVARLQDLLSPAPG